MHGHEGCGFDRFMGREAREGRLNRARAAWDGDFKITRSQSTGCVTGMYFLRRHCQQCHAVIELDDAETPTCPVCGRQFSDSGASWPFYSRRIVTG